MFGWEVTFQKGPINLAPEMSKSDVIFDPKVGLVINL